MFLLTGWGLLFANAKALAQAPGAAAIMADYAATVAELETNCRDNYPAGATVAAATSVVETDVHLKRLEDWRKENLVPYEKALKRFEDAGEAFDAETERLKRMAQLTAAELEERARQYQELLALVARSGPMLTSYAAWRKALSVDIHEWQKKRNLLRSRRH